MNAFDHLQNHVAIFSDLLNTISILKWDARTQMPSDGAQTRGLQLATLARLAQEHFISETTARLLDAAEKEIAAEAPDSYRVRAVQQTRAAYDIICRLPAELVSERTALSSTAEHIWAAARQANDFSAFAPILQQQIDLARRQADLIGYEEHPYGAMLLEYEPSVTVSRMQALFAELKAGILPLLRQISARNKPLGHTLWTQDYPVEKQKAFALEIIQQFGYDLRRGRLDIAPHPFEISFTRQDVRITTRYDRHYLPQALFGTLHEAGHALYEQGVDPALTRSALTTDFLGKYAVGGTSYGAHESQSRLWENQIGRSRAFWQVQFERLRAYFPEQLAGSDPEQFYHAVNRVQPSLIRVEADEVTYNLHIMLRVEIEMGLMDGSIRVPHLPKVWNEKMQEYLGVIPDSDANGVLQDIHWSAGLFGSFPSYTIGNILSAQFMEAAYRDLPELGAALARGQYAPLLGWLTENIYRHGRAYSAAELVQRTTGNEISVQPYLNYLQHKFSDLYGLE